MALCILPTDFDDNQDEPITFRWRGGSFGYYEKPVQIDEGSDMVHIGHVYRLVRFVRAPGFMPYAAMIADRYGNTLTKLFFVQQFDFFFIHLN